MSILSDPEMLFSSSRFDEKIAPPMLLLKANGKFTQGWRYFARKGGNVI
jgi:hypothetical protein